MRQKRIVGKSSAEKSSKNGEKQMPEENDVKTELESLRNILYGEQAKATDHRLDVLNDRVSDIHQELSAQISELLNNTNKKIANLRKELTDQIANQKAEQSAAIQATEKILIDRIDALEESSQKSDDELKKDLNQFASSLGKEKVSRLELSKLLIEVGNSLEKSEANN